MALCLSYHQFSDCLSVSEPGSGLYWCCCYYCCYYCYCCCFPVLLSAADQSADLDFLDLESALLDPDSLDLELALDPESVLDLELALDLSQQDEQLQLLYHPQSEDLQR